MLDRDAGEQVGDLVHLGFPHAEARELLRPQTHAARLHGRRVPGQEVLVRDDVRLLQVRRELRAAADGRHVEGDRVALRESVFLREDLDAPFVERLGERLRIPDDLGRVLSPEFDELGQGDAEGRHRMEVVVRDDAREHGPLKALDELLVVGVAEQDPVLRPGERLVRRSREDVGPFVERVLELSAGDQAEHMGAVVPDGAAGLLEHVAQVGQGRREQEDALSERRHLRFHKLDQRRRPVDVDVHPVHVERIVDVVHAAHAGRPELRGADVRAVAQRHGRHDVARLEEGEVHGHVRDRAARQPRVRMPHPEDLLRQRDDPVLDLVDERVALIVPFVREALGVAVPKVRQEHLPRHRADDVLRRDHREASREPCVVAVHRSFDEGDVFVHVDREGTGAADKYVDSGVRSSGPSRRRCVPSSCRSSRVPRR